MSKHGMLVLSRQRDETVIIGGEIEVTVVDIRGDKVRLGFCAPKEVSVHRKEVQDAIEREGRTMKRGADRSEISGAVDAGGTVHSDADPGL